MQNKSYPLTLNSISTIIQIIQFAMLSNSDCSDLFQLLKFQIEDEKLELDPQTTAQVTKTFDDWKVIIEQRMAEAVAEENKKDN